MFFRLSNKLILTFGIFISSILVVLSKDIPGRACPSLFQYQSSGQNYIGKITLHGAPLTSIKMEAQFSQQEPITTSFSGSLTLFESLSITEAKLKNGKPIEYRVDFPNSRLQPKLIRIRVNDRIICSENILTSEPQTTFTIQHIFYPSITKPYEPPQPSRFLNLFTMSAIRNGLVNTGPFNGPTPSPKPTPGEQPVRNSFDTKTNMPAVSPTISATNPFLPKRPNESNSHRQVASTAMPTAPRLTATKASTPETTSNTATSCGQEGLILTPFMVGGDVFQRGRFPWLSAIYVRQFADLKFICGGSLVSTRTVITAAHCFLDPKITADHVVVHLGRHNLFASENGVEQHDIETLIRHPEFNMSAMSDADIALLHLRSPVSFTHFIRPICLWSSSTVNTDQQLGFVAGWGADNTGFDVTPIPKIVEVNIVSEAECLRSSDIFRTLTSSRSLCAGKLDGSGPCVGDSGGGLMVSNGRGWILRAVVSLGLTNNQNNRRVCNLSKYVVYCDLSKHIRWVHSNVLL